jgi:membrane-bound lytic murein transglycosylase D
MTKAAYAVAVLGLCAIAQAQAEELFPRPAALAPAVEFWTRVYTEVDTQGGFIHDSAHLNVVYEALHFADDTSRRDKRRRIKAATDKYHDILLDLATGSRKHLSAEEKRVLALWPPDVSDRELKSAATRLRFQLGQADRFRAGLIRSGTWRPYIERTLTKAGMPAELAVLPHVESSFDPTAYSKVGAAGMWQFTRSTGLRYLRIDHIVDERRDPFFSTIAAIQLLQSNYAVLGSWPLAITAYNHGLAGMRRAVQELGTTDVGVITEKYSSRTFGFASRNFYAAFLAALDVDAEAERYFGPIRTAPADDTATVQVPDFVTAKTLAGALHLRLADLARLNPALMDTVWAGDKFVPKGFELRVPHDSADDAPGLLAAIPQTQRYASQQPDLYHRVRRGDTLSQIAHQYHVSLAALIRANGLSNRNFIRAGQVLTLPVTGTPRPASLADGAGEALPADGEYVVRRGDSIDKIARRFGLDEAALLRANGIRNRNLIYAGQALRMPGSDADEGTSAVPAQAALAGAVAVEAPSAAALPAIVVDADVADADAVPVAAAADVSPSLTDDPGEAAAAPGADAATAALIDVIDAPARDAAPADGDDESSLDANVLASRQADLAADPSDYTVADDGTIVVQSLETLGHYADWLQIKTQRLRDINGLPFGQAVVLGQRIRLDFSQVDAMQFEQRRIAYQEQRQESFFSSYQIADVKKHVIKAGESLWVLARRTYNVPLWLLRQFNPDLDPDRIKPGAVVVFPLLKPINKDAAHLSTDDSQVSTAGELG